MKSESKTTKYRNMYSILLLSNSGRHRGGVVEKEESSVCEWKNSGKNLSWFVEASGVSCNKKPVSRGGMSSAPVPAGGPCLPSWESWHPANLLWFKREQTTLGLSTLKKGWFSIPRGPSKPQKCQVSSSFTALTCFLVCVFSWRIMLLQGNGQDSTNCARTLAKTT